MARATLKLLLVAAAYAITGWLALLLAIPPGYAAPLFPSAGIALAAACAWGGVGVAGATLGALAVNAALAASDPARWTLPALAATATVVAGVGLQAWLGAWLVRRANPGALALDSGRSIAAFLVLGGPLACLTNATLATAALHLGGLVSADQLWFNWANWWIGDSLGTAIAAPVALAFIGTPRKVWAPRRVVLALPLVALTLVSGYAIARVGQWEQERIAADFRQVANDLGNRVETRLHEHLLTLLAVRGVFIGSDDVSREEFRHTALPWTRTFPSIQAIGWYSRVRADQLHAFELRARDEGVTEFAAFSRDAQGRHLPLPGADEYTLLTYIEPMDANRSALGLDAAALPAVAAAIAQARASDAPVATPPFRLSQETGQQLGVVVYQNDGVPGGDGQGVVFVTMRMENTLAAVLPADAEQVRVCLIDSTEPAHPIRMAGPAECEARPADRRAYTERALDFAGRAWVVRIADAQGTNLLHKRWTAWLFAAVGLLALSLLGAFLLAVSGNTARVQSLVQQRTRELEHEVAERRNTEAALRESEALVRNMLNTASVGLVFCAPDGRFERVNAKFCEIVGYREVELDGLRFADLTHAEDLPREEALIARMLAGEIARYEIEKRYVRKNGREVWAHLVVSLHRGADGAPRSMVAVVEDITERLRLHDAERAREMAEAANRAKSEFLSRMSHELRTPLNAMLGFAQLLAADPRDPLTPAQRERIDRVQRAGWHLLEMINEVLDLSRIEAGNLRLSLEPVDLARLFDECATMVAPQRERRGIALALRIAPGTPDPQADATRLRQVLTNLLSNAVKYNRDGGMVRLEARPAAAGRVEIEVSDTGQGMTAAQLGQLFQPFNRLGRDDSAEEGTGIGLVITKRLVELMDGDLHVQSTPGVGSRFTVNIPATAARASAQAPHADLPAASADYGARRVLYIEDNPINAEVMRGLLALRPQVELTIAETAQAGIAVLGAGRFDLVLLDMHLPDARGIDVLHRLKATPALADLPVLVISADALEDQIRRALDAGAAGYATKPFDMAATLARIDELLGAPRGTRA